MKAKTPGGANPHPQTPGDDAPAGKWESYVAAWTGEDILCMSWRPIEGCAEASVELGQTQPVKDEVGEMTIHEKQIIWGTREVGRSLAGARVSLLGCYSCQQVMDKLLKAPSSSLQNTYRVSHVLAGGLGQYGRENKLWPCPQGVHRAQ